MKSKRIAFISDIHGNYTALEAVLLDCARNRVDEIICLGDIGSIGPEPAACLDRIADLGCLTIQGNHELYLLGNNDDPHWRTCPTWWPLRWSLTKITEQHRGFMKRLPQQVEWRDGPLETLLVHGAPDNPFWGFLPQHADAEIAQRMNGQDKKVVICGHTHNVLFRSWRNSLIVNVGSVGMALDGQPTAQYLIGTRDLDAGWGWQFEFRAVTYDLEKLAAAFRHSGLTTVPNRLARLFMEQMMTGKPVAANFLRDLRRRAKETGRLVSELFEDMAVPSNSA